MKNRKIISIITLIIAILFILFGSFLFINDNNSIKNNEKLTNEEENNEDKNDLLVKKLNKFYIGDYFSYIMDMEYSIGKNLLDINDKTSIMYFYALGRDKMYILYTDEVENSEYLYLKYEDMTNLYRKMFGTEIQFNENFYPLDYGNLVLDHDNIYKLKIADVGDCDLNKTDNCYVMITNYFIPTDLNKIVFSELSDKNNTITGVASLIQKDKPDIILISYKFEFKYKVINNEEYIDSLKIVAND